MSALRDDGAHDGGLTELGARLFWILGLLRNSWHIIGADKQRSDFANLTIKSEKIEPMSPIRSQVMKVVSNFSAAP